MNVHILGNPYKLHKRNEAKAMDHAKKKVATKSGRLHIETQCVLEVHKPILVRLTGSIEDIWDKSMGCRIVSKHNHFHLGKG